MTGNAIVRPDGAPPFVIAAETLKALGLDPRDIRTRAMVLAAERYRLDPLLNEITVFRDQVYITRDGMIKIAHASGQLNGIVIEEERESERGWSATVSVWRKDMTHPFTYRGGCGKTEPQARQNHGAEMALARAERRALRRAFAIPAYDDIDDPVIDDTPPRVLAPSPVGEPPAPTVESPPVPGRGGTTASSADHLLLDPRTAKDGHFVCTCGEIYPTLWGFQAHRTAMLEQLPAEVYDSAPESRGDVDDLQPASYEDPGRPFT